jgi:CubicO group peptidase (beta-lactamase class C family)/D-alanyl-D-alanine dipeptidase
VDGMKFDPQDQRNIIEDKMNRSVLSASAIGFLVLAPMSLAAADGQEPVDYAPAIAKLNAAVQHEVEHKQLPAFSISIVDDQRVIWADGFGYQDADQKIPATAQTVYRVGSVSKLFTDIAVMQLVERGELVLDAAVQSYLPDFKPTNPYGTPITLRQLMTHRSGLVRESPVGNYFDPTEPSLTSTVASLNGTALVYKPETKTKYSNAAIAVVGAVLEQQLSTSHADHVRSSILDPLKMSSSSFDLTPAVDQRLAAGWMRTYHGRRFEAPKFLLGTGPAGNMYSNVTDLSKFLSCLFDDGQFAGGQILKPETYRSMLNPIKDAAGKPQRFGIGFSVQDFDGHTKIGHGGAVYGFSTQLEALPQRKIGVAAVSSLDGSNGVVGRLAQYALRLMLATQDGQPLPEYRTTGTLPPERAKEIVGTYHNDNQQEFVRVTELGGDVFLRRGSYRYDLGWAADNGDIITDDAVGFATPVKLESANVLSVAGDRFRRQSSTPPVASPGRWKGLVGEYGWDHNTLYILEDAGQLFALIEWFYYYPLTEVDENTFEFPDYGLYHGEGLKFTRDSDGNASKVVSAEVEFLRREVGTKDGETFKIAPVKPIDDLRAAALSAAPPAENGDYRDSDLVDLTTLDSTIKLDIRYATTNNFTGAVFYKQPRAFMQRPAAEAVVRANQRLRKRGLGLLIHDAYRPWHVTKMFWDATPGEMKDFVANPRSGSRHNRGCAVDLTLYKLATGEPIQMVAGYDEFSSRSFPLYPGGTARQRWYRELLRQTMQSENFSVYRYEWWHFDFKDWRSYQLGNLTFEQIETSGNE